MRSAVVDTGGIRVYQAVHALSHVAEVVVLPVGIAHYCDPLLLWGLNLHHRCKGEHNRISGSDCHLSRRQPQKL